MFHIASFYGFVPVPNPRAVRERIASTARAEGVKGTVLVAPEGVNATIAGSSTGVDAVVGTVRAIEGFSSIEPKRSTSTTDPFLRLKVRCKREIVSLGVGDVDTASHTGRRIAPEDWNDVVADPDVVVIDVRNTYETEIGSFPGSVDPGLRSFTELPSWFATVAQLTPDTPIAMYCTGGIRCEKASASLIEGGFTNVSQLDGGILTYLERVGPDSSKWHGECYVFDRRVSVGHGLEPGTNEVCPNCNRVVDDHRRTLAGYVEGVTCPACHRSISEDRQRRFTERQRQIELARSRGTSHIGIPL